MKVPVPISIVLLISLLLALTACAGSADSGPAQGGAAPAAAAGGETTLRVGTGFLTGPLAPPTRLTPVSMGLGETLFRLGDAYRAEPWLATGARPLDERTWEVTLRQGVKFHNGVEMDATAVKASLERAFAESPSTAALVDAARIDVQDPYTLVIVTNNPSPILPSLLTAGETAIVEPAAAAAMGIAFNERPVLTGPFKVERYQEGVELVAVRHTEYWGQPPLVGRLIVTNIPDNNSLVLALQSGDIDIARGIPPHSVPILENHPGLEVRHPARFQLNFIFLNTQREVMQDVRVRQAIAHGVNREALVNAVMLGQAAPATGPFPPTFLRCDELRGRSFDPTRAREILSEAGYADRNGDGFVEKDGRTLEISLLSYGQGGFLPPMAEAIQAMLRDIGIRVSIRMVERIDAVLQEGDWDASMFNNNMVHTGDPYGTLFSFAQPGAYLNKSHYVNHDLDAILREMATEADREERQRLACNASQVLVDDAPIVPILYQNYDYGVSRSVTGFDDPYPYFLYLMNSSIGKE